MSQQVHRFIYVVDCLRQETCVPREPDVSKRWKASTFTRLVYTINSLLIIHLYGKLSLYKHSLISVYIRSIRPASLKHLKEVTVAHYRDIVIITHFSSSPYCRSNLAIFPSSACSP